MRLYILAEHRPQPSLPDWVEVSCVQRGDTDYMLAYVSPVDARIEQHWLNRGGKRYRIVPLDQINPSAFIENHDGSLNVCLVYGFAAHAGRLTADPKTGQVPLDLGI